MEVPRYFYDDHVSRELPAGRVLRTTRRYAWVELNESEFAELLSDARHYSNGFSPEHCHDADRLMASARATVKRLEAARLPH